MLYAAVQGRPERFLNAFMAAGRRAIAEGVDVLLPGQTIITELLWKAGVTRLEEAVVLDPRLPMLRMAETMIELKQAGITPARRGFYGARPPAELSAAVAAFYGIRD